MMKGPSMQTIEFYPSTCREAPRDVGAALADVLSRWWKGRRVPRRNAIAVPAQPADAPDVLVGLDARVLRDIGAPDRLLARALTHREILRGDRDALRLGIASGAWHHW
jgi:hypothetical protein